MIQAEIYRVLSESAAIANIISSRIYPVNLPKDAIVPAIVYTIEEIVPIKSLGGESGIDNGTIEISCWAKDYTTAHQLAAAVRAAFAEAEIGVMTGNMQDDKDEQTRNYVVVMVMNILSNST
jgi:hypothetical protein